MIDTYGLSVGEVLEDCGVDPHGTPVDALPSHAQWALAGFFHALENDE